MDKDFDLEMTANSGVVVDLELDKKLKSLENFPLSVDMLPYFKYVSEPIFNKIFNDMRLKQEVKDSVLKPLGRVLEFSDYHISSDLPKFVIQHFSDFEKPHSTEIFKALIVYFNDVSFKNAGFGVNFSYKLPKKESDILSCLFSRNIIEMPELSERSLSLKFSKKYKKNSVLNFDLSFKEELFLSVECNAHHEVDDKESIMEILNNDFQNDIKSTILQLVHAAK